tara:strand:- start:6835 stop:6963 length:129 start_codon:yes stop_codon:yes gene_type:complete
MAKGKVTAESRKISFGKRRVGKARNMNTPKGKNVKKYKGQGR